MKVAVVLVLSLTFVLARVPKNRFDPCIFIDCTKHTTSTKAPTTSTTTSNNPGNGLQPNELQKIKTQLVRVLFTEFT